MVRPSPKHGTLRVPNDDDDDDDYQRTVLAELWYSDALLPVNVVLYAWINPIE